jgi:uncharacterized protein (TIGR00251 family)
MPAPIEQHGRDVLVRIKVVPGASRTQLAGTLGDRIKIRVSAPPEQGKANKAIIELLARTLSIKANQVTIEVGHTSAEKTIRITGANLDAVRNALT